MTENDSQPQTSQSPLRRTQPIILFREDSIADSVTKTLEYDPANPAGVFDVVKEYGTASFGFAGDATLRLFAASKPGSERVPIANDEQLRDVLSAGDENTQLEVYVGVEQTAPVQRIRITAECHPDHSDFEFAFSLTDTNVKTRLFRDAVAAIQTVNSSYTAPADTEELELAVEGEKTKVRSDKVLLEVLQHGSNSSAAAPITVILPGGLDASRSRRKSTVNVEATYRAALTTSAANFTFRYHGDEGNLLESFRSECRGELELPAGCKVSLTATTADGPVAITGDSQLLALLSATADDHVLRVELTDSESSAAPLSIETKCSLAEGEDCSFAFKVRIDEPNLLGSLRAAVINSLDLDDGELTLTYVDDATKETVVLSSDRQLRDIVAHHHEAAIPMELKVQAKKRHETVPVPLKTFHITHGDTQATFANYKCPQGPGELLRSLLHDIRWEFELLRRSGADDSAQVSLALDAKLASGTVSVAEDDPDNLFAQVAGAPDTEVNIVVVSSEAPQSAVKHTHWLRANVHAKIGDGREYTTFVFRCSAGQPDLLKEFSKALAGELELEGDDEATIVIFDGTVDPPTQIDKDADLFALATTEQFHQPHRFVAEIELPYRAPASPHARSASRMAELNALTAEWKDALEGLWRPSNIEQMAATFLMEGTPLPSDDALMVHLREALKDDEPRRVEDLHDTLLEWTSHFGEELFSAFCHHCREVLDFVVDFSPLSRLKRAISVAFRQMSVGLRVGKAELVQVLNESKAIAQEDIDECLAAYGESLAADEFTEALTWLFRDAPQDIIDVITVLQHGANRSPTRARREVELLRRKRLQSEIRHAFDSVSVFHVKDFAGANRDTDEQDWLNLAHAVALLLNDDVGRTKDDPAQASWKWLMSQVDEEKKAMNFLSHLGQTQRSYASLGDISLAVTFLLAPGAEAGALLPASKLLSSLSLWALRLAQLTCHAQRWTWPPPGAFTHATPPASHHVGSPIKVSPPVEERSTALVTARPRRYEFKHRSLSTEYAAVELEPPKPTTPGRSLKELMEEQRQNREDGGAATPPTQNGTAHKDENGNGNAQQEEEPKQIEDSAAKEEPKQIEDSAAKDEPAAEPQPTSEAKQEEPESKPQTKSDPEPEPAPTTEERRRSSVKPAQPENGAPADAPTESNHNQDGDNSATNGETGQTPRSKEQEDATVQLQLAGRQKLARDEVEDRKRTRSQPPAE